MNPLKLSPLPSTRPADESRSLAMEREGFVDEAVVLALITGPSHPRRVSYPEDLALAADDLDFAGWQQPSAAPSRPRTAEVPPHVIDAIVRRAAPPVLQETGISPPHHGAHRWWLAGLAGVLATMLFSVLLLSLASRPEEPFEAISKSVKLTRATPPLPRTIPPLQASPELTDASPHRP